MAPPLPLFPPPLPPWSNTCDDMPTQCPSLMTVLARSPASVWRSATCGIPLEASSRSDLRGCCRSGNAARHLSATSRLHTIKYPRLNYGTSRLGRWVQLSPPPPRSSVLNCFDPRHQERNLLSLFQSWWDQGGERYFLCWAPNSPTLWAPQRKGHFLLKGSRNVDKALGTIWCWF